MKTALWNELGGFPDFFFAYGEDVELSLRAHVADVDVRIEPAGVAYHYYQFTRNGRKYFLLERNRLATMLTVYEARTLLILAPALLIVELGMLFQAVRSGWLKQKLSSYVSLIAVVPKIRSRRRSLAGMRKCTDRELAAILSPRVDPPAKFGFQVPKTFNDLLAWYWSRVIRLL